MSSKGPELIVPDEYRSYYSLGFEQARIFAQSILQNEEKFTSFFATPTLHVAKTLGIQDFDPSGIYHTFCSRYQQVTILNDGQRSVIFECHTQDKTIHTNDLYMQTLVSTPEANAKRDLLYTVKLLHELQHLVVAAVFGDQNTPVKLGTISKVILPDNGKKSFVTVKGDSGILFEELMLGGRFGIASAVKKTTAFDTPLELYVPFGAESVEEFKRGMLNIVHLT